MRTALEREFFALCTHAASRLSRHDPAVVLGVCLCFAPFPPVSLAGLMLTGLNFALVRGGKLPDHETPLLRLGVAAFVVYAALWTPFILWVIHTRDVPAAMLWLKAWWLWLQGGVSRPPSSTNLSIQRV